MDRTSSKKSKKSKENKKRRASTDTFKMDDKGILRKQKELMRVLHVKTFQLQHGTINTEN
uniref:Uncharacterized protein n=1 Tax=Glossina pallidipes TaxID=7398 RepID=A0A1B0A4E9_GLOPL